MARVVATSANAHAVRRQSRHICVEECLLIECAQDEEVFDVHGERFN
jgi:hypothetical protein